MKTNNTIKISNGNSKVGRIPNLSLTPGKTCSAEACKTCLCGVCYAMKSYRMYSNVRNAWDSNTEMAVNNLDEMERQLTKYFAGMNAPRFFRLHVAGDFVSREYTMMWARIAAAAPHTNFLAFTKQWDNVRGRLPLQLLFGPVCMAWHRYSLRSERKVQCCMAR